jgi:hypothetical protein
VTRSPTPTRWCPRLEQLEDRCTPSCMSADCPTVITAPLGGGHAQVALLVSADSVALELPNGAIHFYPGGPIRGLLTAAFPGGPIFPGGPVIPTSFQGNLGGGASPVVLQISEGTAFVDLPNGVTHAYPSGPLFPSGPVFGLLTAAGWAG